jgi:hypothetical protein
LVYFNGKPVSAFVDAGFFILRGLGCWVLGFEIDIEFAMSLAPYCIKNKTTKVITLKTTFVILLRISFLK